MSLFRPGLCPRRTGSPIRKGAEDFSSVRSLKRKKLVTHLPRCIDDSPSDALRKKISCPDSVPAKGTTRSDEPMRSRVSRQTSTAAAPSTCFTFMTSKTSSSAADTIAGSALSASNSAALASSDVISTKMPLQ